MHEVRPPNIYVLSDIIFHIHPLTIIIALAITAVGVFTMRYSDVKN